MGLLKPNPLGMFDVHGNVSEWCQELYFRQYPTAEGRPVEDKEDLYPLSNTVQRTMRGGNYHWQSSTARSAHRAEITPNARYRLFGFRIARSLPGPKESAKKDNTPKNAPRPDVDKD